MKAKGSRFAKLRHLLIATSLLPTLFCFSSIASEENGPGGEEFHTGNLLFNRKEYAAAEPHFAAAIKENPKESGYRGLHVSCLINLGRYKEAIEDLKLSSSPRDSPGHKSLLMGQVATCYAEMHDWPNALRAYEILSQTPYSRYDPWIMNDLARVYGMAGMNEKAIAERKLAIRYGWTEHDDTAFQCNMLASRQMDRALAMGEYAESRGDRNSSLMQFMAKAHLRQGQYARALQEITPCCKTADLCALNWGIRGEIDFYLGHYAEAINDLNTAIKLPINPSSLLFETPGQLVLQWQRIRTKSYLGLKKYPEALASENAAIASMIGTSDPQLLAERGAIYYLQKNYEKSVADFSQVIAKVPEQRQSAYFLRARSYYLMGKLGDARADLKKSIVLNDNDFNSHFFLSVVDMQQKEFKEAVDDLTKALKVNSAAPTLYLERRADAHFQLAEYREAIDDYSLAIDLDATQPWLLAGRALAYDKVNLPDKAGKDLEAIEVLKRKSAKQATSDSREKVVNKLAPSLVFLEKSISDRRNQILAAASKLKTVTASPPLPVKVK
jgi:tetratricopeptide (TPR) repeat protein